MPIPLALAHPFRQYARVFYTQDSNLSRGVTALTQGLVIARRKKAVALGMCEDPAAADSISLRHVALLCARFNDCTNFSWT